MKQSDITSNIQNNISNTSPHTPQKTTFGKVTKAIHYILSFLLAVLLTLLLILSSIRLTILSPDFVYKSMENTNYFSYKENEIKESFIDIGLASGLNKDFWDKVVDKNMITTDTKDYIYNYYYGKSSVVDLTDFEKHLRNELDNFISANNIKNVDPPSLKYLIVITRSTYKAHLEIPMFSKIAFYVVIATKWLPVLIGIIYFIICLMIFTLVFTQKRKSDTIKYLLYSSISSFLIIGIVPVIILISDKIKYINLSSEGLYKLVTYIGNNFCYSLIFSTIICLILSVLLVVLSAIINHRQHCNLSSTKTTINNID